MPNQIKPVLLRGSKGAEVSRVQTRLKELRYYDGAIDGLFGSQTEAAVKSFQRDRKLTADGKVGLQTRNLLLARFQFDNYSRFVGSRGDYQWFAWKIFMNEPPEKLAQVRSVEYRLHETFPNPIRIVEDRGSRFALKSTGWGEFWVFVTVYLEDGTEEMTQHWLDLGKPWPPGEA